MNFSNFDLVLNLVKKDIQIRYMGSTFGFLWSLGNPLITTIMYYIVFTLIFPNTDTRFALYLVTGILHWNLVSQLLPQSCEWLTNNGNLLKKVWFPRMLIPLASVCTTLIFWCSALLVYALLFKFLGGEVSLSLIIYPVVLASFICFLIGCSLLISVYYVDMRDLKYIIDVLMPLLFWCTPIIWKVTSLNPSILFWIKINPLTIYFKIFSDIFYSSRLPALNDLLIAVLIGFGMLLIGLVMFNKLSKNIVESL